MSALACRDNNLLSLLVQDLMFMAKKNWKKNDIQVEEYLRKLHCNIIDEKCGQYKFLQRTLNIIYHFASQKKGSNMGPPLKTNSKETTEKLQHNFLKEH